MATVTIKASSCLMEDAITTNAANIAAATKENQIALYSNLFANGAEEALVIDQAGHLTHLARAVDGVGWRQTHVLNFSGEKIKATEVVIAPEPSTSSYWAFYAGVSSVGTVEFVQSSDAPNGHWQFKSFGPPFGVLAQLTHAAHLNVFYGDEGVCIFGVCKATQKSVFRLLLAHDPYDPTDKLSIKDWDNFPTNVTKLCGGRCGGVDSYWVEANGVVTYWQPGAGAGGGGSPGPARGDGDQAVQKLVGVFKSSTPGDLGGVALWIDSSAAPDRLMTFQRAKNDKHKTFITQTALPTAFESASLWPDRNGLMHLYGWEKPKAGQPDLLTFQALRQSGWATNDEYQVQYPTWAKTDHEANAVPACIPLKSGVMGFAMDPHPDLAPNFFFTLSQRAPLDRYSLERHDLATRQWTDEAVRLVGDAETEPELVSHYVTQLAVVDENGNAVARQKVSVIADAQVEVICGAASYLVGPKRAVELEADAGGRLSLAVHADSLTPPTFTIAAIGASGSVTVEPAGAVHQFLAGKQGLASQKGPFNETALDNAKANNQSILNGNVPTDPVKRKKALEGVVNSVTNTFKIVDDKQIRSRLTTGAPPIHGFSLGRLIHGELTYSEYRTADEMAAHLNHIRALPNYGGIWEDLSDLWEGIKNGAIEVLHAFVDGAARLIIKIGEAIVEFTNMLIDSLVKAAHVVEACFRQVVDAAKKVVDWLKALFDFKDIWETKRALQSGLATMCSYGSVALGSFQKIGHDWFETKRADVKGAFDALKAQYGARALGSFSGEAPPCRDATGGKLETGAIQSNPQANWMLNQTQGHVAQGKYSLKLRAAAPDDPGFEAQLEKLKSTLADSGFVTPEIKNSFERWMAQLFSPSDPGKVAGEGLSLMFDFFQQLVDALLAALDRSVQAFFEIARFLLDHVSLVLGLELDFGPINTLYKWIQTSNGVPADQAEPLTVGGLMFLIAGFFVTVIYKLVRGVGEAPFPGGKFPALPAPLGHPDYRAPRAPGASLSPDEVQALAAHDRAMVSLQIACAACGIAGGLLELVIDMEPLMKTPPTGGHLLLAFGSMVLTNMMFTTVLTCPPVTGAAWGAGEWPSLWTGVFMTSIFPFLAQAAFIYLLFKHPNDPILKPEILIKNAFDCSGGPIGSFVINFIMIVVAGIAAGRDGLDSYSKAAVVLPFLGGCLQMIRSKMVFPDVPRAQYVVRCSFVAAVDLLAIETAALLTLVAAALPAPYIDEKQSFTAHRGVDCNVKVEASGGGHVFDEEPKGFVAFNLPRGLWMDADTGRIRGEALTVTSGPVEFQVICHDGFRPPKYSNFATLEITVED